MAGVVASMLRHEVSNPLQAILSEAQLLGSAAAGTPDAAAAARTIEEAARRIAAVLVRVEDRVTRAVLEQPDHCAGNGPAARTPWTAPPVTRGAWPRGTDDVLPPLTRRSRRLQVLPRDAAPAPGTGADLRVVAVALANRIQRLVEENRLLQRRLAGRDDASRAAAHELRNATHVFTGWLYALRRSPARGEPWFEPLTRTAEAVLRRAEQALVGEAGAVYDTFCERVDLAALARETLEMVRPEASYLGISIAAVTPSGNEAVVVSADPDRVQQIVLNLLRNALRATPTGGTITLTTRAEDGCGIIEVEDTGPGLPNDIERLLAPIEPGSPAGASDPRGLGLRLSATLARSMGGELLPCPGDGGACLRLRLPAYAT